MALTGAEKRAFSGDRRAFRGARGWQRCRPEPGATPRARLIPRSTCISPAAVRDDGEDQLEKTSGKLRAKIQPRRCGGRSQEIRVWTEIRSVGASEQNRGGNICKRVLRENRGET